MHAFCVVLRRISAATQRKAAHWGWFCSNKEKNNKKRCCLPTACSTCTSLSCCLTRVSVQIRCIFFFVHYFSRQTLKKLKLAHLPPMGFHATIIRGGWQDYIINGALLTGVFNQPACWLKSYKGLHLDHNRSTAVTCNSHKDAFTFSSSFSSIYLFFFLQPAAKDG